MVTPKLLNVETAKVALALVDVRMLRLLDVEAVLLLDVL
jgi:hypothetical protein